jgi:hypothetical protein
MNEMKSHSPLLSKQPETEIVVDQEMTKFMAEISGSVSEKFTSVLINQVLRTLWLREADKESKNDQIAATIAAMQAIRPRDPLEGMLTAQMIATHNAVMQCLHQAVALKAYPQRQQENLNMANKLTRSYTMQMEALNRHRGKGQQKVTVEHVHVHSGGQAIVGAINSTKTLKRRGGRGQAEK